MPVRLSRGACAIQSSKEATASVSRTGGSSGSGATTASVKQAKIDASRGVSAFMRPASYERPQRPALLRSRELGDRLRRRYRLAALDRPRRAHVRVAGSVDQRQEQLRPLEV